MDLSQVKIAEPEPDSSILERAELAMSDAVDALHLVDADHGSSFVLSAFVAKIRGELSKLRDDVQWLQCACKMDEERK